MAPRKWNSPQISAMKIEDLPDDCLLAIIELLPLKHALSVRVVNGRWDRLVKTMFRGRKNLFLFGSFRALADYSKRLIRFGENPEWDVSSSTMGQYSLIITQSRLTENVLSRLLALFPNIQKLVFFYYSWPKENEVRMILEQYQNTLISLTVHGMPTLEDGLQHRTWTAINELSKLTRFHLFATDRVVFPVHQIVPLFARLEHFTLVDYLHGDCALLLAQLGPRLKALILDNVQLSKERLENVVQHAPHLEKSLSHLFIGNVAYPTNFQLPANLALLPNDQPILVNDQGVIAEIIEFRLPIQHRPVNRQRRVNVKNPENILEFICNTFQQLNHVDVAFMINGREVSFLCHLIQIEIQKLIILCIIFSSLFRK